jgi:carboxypeptidase A2
MRFLVAAVLLAVCVVGANALRRYDGYQLLRLHPSFPLQWKATEIFGQDDEIDVWAENQHFVDIFVPPQRLSDVRAYLAEHQIKFELSSDRIQQDIEEEATRLASRKRSAGRAIDYDDFNTYEDILVELDDLAARAPGQLNAATFSIGSSFEGRDIKGLRTTGSGGGRAIWVDATIHAREWLATATNLKILSHLIDDYATDSEVQALHAQYDFYFVPIVNPDGYAYTWSDDRLWRKNRAPNAGSACVGTDLNRNFAEEWGNAGTSDSPCSETYGGTGPASEPETQALQNYLVSVGSTLLTSFHFHTYGQLWLIPWGSTTAGGACNFADDHNELLAVANAGADAVENTHGSRWERGNSCATIYPASGITMDFSKARAGIKYTTTPELRGNNFIISADQIQPSFEEVWNGLIATFNAIPQ